MSKTLSLLSWENVPTTSPWWGKGLFYRGFREKKHRKHSFTGKMGLFENRKSVFNPVFKRFNNTLKRLVGTKNKCYTTQKAHPGGDR